MTRVCCNLCGANETSLFLRKGGYTIVSCKRCGLVYVNPRDSVEKMLMTYSRPYFELEKFSDGARIGYRNYAADHELHRGYFRKKLKAIMKRTNGGRLLDVGCALGYFLEEAKNVGFDVWGIDVSFYAAREARKLVGSKRIWLGSVQDAPYVQEEFQVITCFQTLEHLPDPLADLRQLWSLLSPGGLLVLVVPDRGGLMEKLMGRAWYGYKPKEHLYYFDSRTLVEVLSKAGFEKISVSWDNARPYPLSYSLERIRYLYPKFTGVTQVFETVLRSVGAYGLNIPVFLGDLSVVAFKGEKRP